MADADYLADRRRLRRKVSFWRVAAILTLIVAVVGIGLYAGRNGLPGAQPQIARIAIRGFIAGDQATIRLIERVGNDARVQAVFVAIDSPGGTTTGAETLHAALRQLSAKKPTVAVVEGTAASGAYIAALGTQRIVAHETSLVGSIGVLFQYPNLTGLLETLGVRVEEIKSSPLKAAPNPFEPATPEARAAMQALVADTYAWFRGLVRSGRNLNEAELATVADGRVFTGRQAVPLKLIDEIGGERQAMAWLRAQGKIDRDLPVRDWRPRSESSTTTLWSAIGVAADLAGMQPVADAIRRAAQTHDGMRLDGLLAVWHPALEK